MQAAFGVGILRIGIFRPQVAVGVVKQAHIVFDVQHVAGRVIQLRHRHLPGLHQPGQILAVVLVAHAHVDAGLQRHAHRVFRVRRHAVFNQLLDGPMVGDGDAFKAPLVAQHVLEQPGVGGRRGAVKRVKGHHDRAAAGIQPRFVRRHIVVEQALRTHINGVVFFAAFDRAVGRKVLDAGHHRVAIGRAFPLHRLHHRPAHLGSQVGIFPESFRGAAPARVTGDIDHRRPGHVQAIIGRFVRRYSPDGIHRVEVKRGGQTKANRENGALTVEHVIGEKQRNFQAAEFHHLILHSADIMAGHGVKNRPHLTFFDHFADGLFRVIRADAN